MSRKHKYKLVVASNCRKCGEQFSLSKGIVATESYCSHCSRSRRQLATKKLGLKPITVLDFDGSYLTRAGR